MTTTGWAVLKLPPTSYNYYINTGKLELINKTPIYSVYILAY